MKTISVTFTKETVGFGIVGLVIGLLIGFCVGSVSSHHSRMWRGHDRMMGHPMMMPMGQGMRTNVIYHRVDAGVPGDTQAEVTGTTTSQ